MIIRGINVRTSRGQLEPNGRLDKIEIESITEVDDDTRPDWLSFLDMDVRTRLLRIARTVADIDGSACVNVDHLNQAREMTFPRPPIPWRR